MELLELLGGRRDWSEEETIYVVEPWSADAESLVSSATPNTQEPVVRGGKIYAYFLEGVVARDFLDDLGAPDDVGVAACERLIRYALNDA